MKNQKGITLVALVVTIIVLLILAGISIAMLTGENGIITNAQEAATANAYYGAEEQVKLAYMAVRTEIMAQTVKNGTYDATEVDNGAEPEVDNPSALADIVKKDLSDSKWTVTVDGSTIKIRYTDSAIDAGVLGSRKYMKTTYSGDVASTAEFTISSAPVHEGYVDYTITLRPQTATLEIDV